MIHHDQAYCFSACLSTLRPVPARHLGPNLTLSHKDKHGIDMLSQSKTEMQKKKLNPAL